LTAKDGTGARGINVIAIEPRTHNILVKRAYNTADSVGESRQLARDLRALAPATILLVAVKEDAIGSITKGV